MNSTGLESKLSNPAPPHPEVRPKYFIKTGWSLNITEIADIDFEKEQKDIAPRAPPLDSKRFVLISDIPFRADNRWRVYPAFDKALKQECLIKVLDPEYDLLAVLKELRGEGAGNPRWRMPTSHAVPEEFYLTDTTIQAFERFVITDANPLGQGAWSAVFRGYDRLLEDEVAIKILQPSEVAIKQMMQRKLTPESATTKGVRKLYASKYLVRTELHKTKNGKDIIVMAPYKKFFNQVLDEASQRQDKHKAFGSGLAVEEIARYANDLLSGVQDFHYNEHRAHADLKPDNIAVDNDYGHLLLADFGTATTSSFIDHENPRDHSGHQYIRAPSQFQREAHPTRASDIFSAGSVMYKMFTGKFLFEDEINSKLTSSSTKALDDWMAEYCKGAHREMLARKLSQIPKEFHEFFNKCATESWNSAEEAQDCFNEVLRVHHHIVIGERAEERDRERKAQQMREELKRKYRPLGWAASVLGLLSGIAIVIPIYKHPEYFLPYNLRTQITLISAEKNDLILDSEQTYEKIPGTVAAGKPHQVGQWPFVREPSLAHVFVDMYVKTAAALNYKVNTELIQSRAMALSTSRKSTPPEYREALLTIAEYAIGQNTRDRQVDLEDAAYSMHLSEPSLINAWKLAGSLEFSKYRAFTTRPLKDRTSNQYKLVAAPEEQAFVRQLIYNITQALPAKVQIVSDSSRSGSGARAP